MSESQPQPQPVSQQALILFAHGARDPNWAAPFESLQQLIQRQRPQLLVKLAFLELMQPDLPQLLQQLAAAGVSEVSVVPVFLGQGGHVRRDLPGLIAQAQQQHPHLTITVAQAVGEQPDVLNSIAEYCISTVPSPNPLP
ncbi:CbiX/SirB N-terminal domain-containing protein [Collimonas sp.]|jgi:sirohydrochlorin cobaltochelatase|uniref:sirohydrochlorin chelatase n=1 Tax=Collimonas sp. TaxID=1963772 RepID=UPI002C2DFB3A|nr:CbiX/SirB N-terminal domain-containing protein [Collimonas sp.]HWW06642.1 CbiX/SirB N-terminal domain-containing protein [Collimonas sp.]